MSAFVVFRHCSFILCPSLLFVLSYYHQLQWIKLRDGICCGLRPVRKRENVWTFIYHLYPTSSQHQHQYGHLFVCVCVCVCVCGDVWFYLLIHYSKTGLNVFVCHLFILFWITDGDVQYRKLKSLWLATGRGRCPKHPTVGAAHPSYWCNCGTLLIKPSYLVESGTARQLKAHVSQNYLHPVIADLQCIIATMYKCKYTRDLCGIL